MVQTNPTPQSPWYGQGELIRVTYGNARLRCPSKLQHRSTGAVQKLDQRKSSISSCIKHAESLLCGRRWELRRGTALLNINTLQPSLPSGAAVVWSILCSEPGKGTDLTIPVSSKEAQEAHQQQQCCCATPCQEFQFLLLVQPRSRAVPHPAYHQPFWHRNAALSCPQGTEPV